MSDSQTLIDLMRRNLDKEAAEIVDPLARGNCEDYPSYMAATGKLAGLRLAREIFDDLVKRINNGLNAE